MKVHFSTTQLGVIRCLNNDPQFDVTIKCKDVELQKVPYKPGVGEDSFEVMEPNMTVMVVLNNHQVKEYKCNRMIEEFNKLLLIKDFEQISFNMEDINTIMVRK